MKAMVELTKLKDFRNFLYLVWKHLRLPKPTPLQFDIANYLQSKQRRLIIQGFRGIGKSWVTSAFVCHQLLLNPQLNILVVSASKTRSDDFSTFTLRLINELDVLAHLRPSEDQRQSKIAFDVKPARASHQPSVKSVGIFGMITGSRADLVIADDIETSANTQTVGMRDRLSTSVKEFESVIKPEGRIVFLGTPQTESSLYSKLGERGYKTRVWTARYPKQAQAQFLNKNLAPIILRALELNPELEDKPTEPTRFSDMELLERETSYGKSAFALQFQLDTRLSDENRYPLKLKDLQVTSLNPEKAYEHYVWASNPEQRVEQLPCVGLEGDCFNRPMALNGELIDYSGAQMSIDVAGSGADETGVCISKFLNGNIFIFYCSGLAGGYDERTLGKITELAKEHKVKSILIEKNFGQGMFSQLLRPYLRKKYPVVIEEVHNTKQKERRIIETLEPLMNQHRLIFDVSVIERDYQSTQHMSPESALRYQLMYQMSRVTKDRGSLKHDDRLDALSMSCNYWLEQIARDSELAVRDRKNELLETELENFMDGALGNKKQRINTWLN